ncbi:hypothetical protein A2U01_0118690, partial [Trifolium medium]|nr:hypothetical protein [Trifolium medium]
GEDIKRWSASTTPCKLELHGTHGRPEVAPRAAPFIGNRKL